MLSQSLLDAIRLYGNGETADLQFLVAKTIGKQEAEINAGGISSQVSYLIVSGVSEAEIEEAIFDAYIARIDCSSDY